MENNRYFQFAIVMSIGMLITIIDRKPDLVTAIFAAAFFVSAGQFLFREKDTEPTD